MSWDIETVDSLDIDALARLRREDTAAIRLPGYCTSDVSDRIATLLISHPERTNYEVRWARRAAVQDERFASTDVDRVGLTDSAGLGQPTRAETVGMMRAIRAAAAPGLGPIDRLRLELDEIAPNGAFLYRKDGQISLSGVGRVMSRSDEVVHADTGRRNCLTANVYLRMPSEGGGTRIWRYDGPYRDSPRSYRFGPDEIPHSTPSCVLSPEPGDLVIWNPALPHAVLKFSDGPRVTLQTWLLIPESSPSDFSVRLLN